MSEEPLWLNDEVHELEDDLDGDEVVQRAAESECTYEASMNRLWAPHNLVSACAQIPTQRLHRQVAYTYMAYSK